MKLAKIKQSKRKVGGDLDDSKPLLMISMYSPLKIAVPAECYGTVSVFRQIYHRLAFTIHRPDHLAQQLCARCVIDESTVVSARFCLLIALICFDMFVTIVQ